MARVPFTSKNASGLRKMRKQRGLTQYQLAEKLGWVRSKIKRLEKHEVSSIHEDDLVALANALKIKPDPPKPSRKKKTKAVKGKLKPPETKKAKADKGKPKPRLDYREGTALVARALQEARAEGKPFLYRDALQKATGYTACQVRTFAKRLEAKGILSRDGVGRGMKYTLIDQVPNHPPVPVTPTKFRQRLDQAHRELARKEILSVLREIVKIPPWLLTLMAEEGLSDLKVREIWDPQT